MKIFKKVLRWVFFALMFVSFLMSLGGYGGLAASLFFFIASFLTFPPIILKTIGDMQKKDGEKYSRSAEVIMFIIAPIFFFLWASVLFAENAPG